MCSNKAVLVLSISVVVFLSSFSRINKSIDAHSKFPVCVSGDCQNGFGTYRYLRGEEIDMEYRGNFSNGKFNGLGVEASIGFTYQIKDILKDAAFYEPTTIGYFIDGELDRSRFFTSPSYHQNTFDGILSSVNYGKKYGVDYSRLNTIKEHSDEIAAFYGKSHQIKNDGSTKSRVYLFFHVPLPSGKTLNLHQPFSTQYGACISGGCGLNGDKEGVLLMKDLGRFKGSFNEDGSASTGLLMLETGDGIYMEFKDGILVHAQNDIVPEGYSRVELAKKDAWLMREVNMCLEGNCRDKEAITVSSHVRNCWGQRLEEDLQGIFTGKLRTVGISMGKGTYEYYEYTGFKLSEAQLMCNGIKDTVSLTYLNGEGTVDAYFVDGVRYTMDGKEPYDTYIKRKWNQNMQAEMAEAIKKAEEKRKAREAATRQSARYSVSRPSTRPYSGPCRMCKGSGTYWYEWVDKKCTETHDYTYSSGKYKQVSTDCEDIKRGAYVRCNVCGGSGRIN